MAEFQMKITNAGKALLAKALAGKVLHFKHIAVGSGVYTGNQENATALKKQVATVGITHYYPMDTMALVKGTLQYNAVPSGFAWTELGLIATDPDTQQDVLYMYSYVEYGDLIPPSTAATQIEKTIQIATYISNAQNITVNLTSIENPPIKTCRFTVGTVQAGWSLNDCDYLCDGVDDQAEINKAINALPETGGEIVILDGTYNISDTIKIPNTKSNVKIRGNGADATILKCLFSDGAKGTISIQSTNTDISNITIDNNRDADILTGSCIIIDGNKNIIHDCILKNSQSYGLYLSKGQDNYARCNKISNCNIGIHSTATSSIILNNTCENITDKGISASNSSANNCTIISSNKLLLCANAIYGGNLFDSLITNNICKEASQKAIYLYNSSRNTIANNICVRGTGTSGDYSEEQHNIYTSAQSSNNLIMGNQCQGKAPTINGTGNVSDNNITGLEG